MTELDLEHLLGGFATNTLTEAEHQALYRAAMVNQRLFDLLADEQALRELLDDPAVRRRLLDKLKDPPGQERTAWVGRWFGWVVRPETLTVVGSLAVLALATVLGLQLWEESQNIKRTEESARPLSQIIKEPTVRSKLGAKSTPPQSGRPQDVSGNRSEKPSGPASVKTDDVPPRPPAVSPKGEKAASAPSAASQSSPPARPARERTAVVAEKDRSEPADSLEEDQQPDEADLESTEAVPPAPAQLPPVVLPRVPAKGAKGQPDEPTESRTGASEVPAMTGDTSASVPEVPEDSLTPEVTPEVEQKAETDLPSTPEPEAVPEPEPSLEMEPESVVAATRSSVQAAEQPTQPLPFVDNLERPVVGNARTLFAGALDVRGASADETPSTGRANDVQPGSLERHQILGALSKNQESDAAENTTTIDDRKTDATRNQSGYPLALRFHHKQPAMKGRQTGPLSQGFAIPRLTVEVNQPGYLYVIMGDASGGWTVVSPAGSQGTTPAPARPDRPYEVILLADAREQAIRPSYVVFSKEPVPELDKALTLATTTDQAASSSRELEALISTWVKGFGDQSLKMEQVAETFSGPKPVQTTYVADAADPQKPAILYRLPAAP